MLVSYVRWLGPAVSPYAGGSDSSGYLWSARLFREGRLSVRISPPQRFPVDATGTAVLAPLGGAMRPETMDLVPTYPTGLPLHIAAASLFLDEERAVRTVLLFAVAGALWLLYLIGRDAGLPRVWAAAGSGMLACSPLFLFSAVQPASDILATFWGEAAVLCAWRSRRRPALAWLAGGSLGIATLVRPTNLILILPVLAALTPSAGTCVRLAGGGLTFAAFVLAYQSWAYGGPLRSGYGSVSSLFAWGALLPSLSHYLRWGPQLASWLVVFAPAAAWLWRGDLARWRLVGAAWILATFGTYAFYAVTAETWWYMRYVLPGFPILIVAGLAGLRVTVHAAASRAGRPWAARASGAVACAVVIVSAGALLRSPSFAEHRAVKPRERVYRDAVAVMGDDAALPHPVLMSQLSGAANYYRPGNQLIRFDLLTAEGWRAVREWQRRERLPIGAALFGFERNGLFSRPDFVPPCEWQPRGHYLDVTFWGCPPPGRQ